MAVVYLQWAIFAKQDSHEDMTESIRNYSYPLKIKKRRKNMLYKMNK